MNQYKKLLNSLSSNKIYDYIRSLNDSKELEEFNTTSKRDEISWGV